MFSQEFNTGSWQNLCTVKKYLYCIAPVANLFPNCSQQVSMYHLCVIYFSKWWVLRWQSFSVCDIHRGWASWRERGRGGSACLLWFTVSCVPVSRQAWSSGSCTPALSHTSAWQAKLLKGRTGGSQTKLGSAYPWNKNSMLSVCLSLPLMSECFINKREPRRLPPVPVSSV